MLIDMLMGIVAGIVVLAVVIAVLPADFRVSRSATIAAPAAAAFAPVNDLHQWTKWSPFEKGDPDLKRTYEGPTAGLGAVYGWDGNKRVGAGRMTVVESRPGEIVRLKLEFFRPFVSTSAAEFTFSPEGGQTRVTWTMTGKKNFIMKGFGLVSSMDKMVGGMFEDGLRQLKAVAEAAPKQG